MATVTPTYSWPVPTSTDYVADGAVAIEALGDAIDSTVATALGGAYPGLRLVKKQTVGTAVSSVTVTSCFNANFENYKIMYSGGVGSVNGEIFLQLTGITTGVYNSQLTYGAFGSNSAPASVSASNATLINWSGAFSTIAGQFDLEIQNPFATKVKIASGLFINPSSSGNNGTSRHFVNSTISSTGFTLTTSAGTITGGTIYVYGYGAS